MLLEALVTLKAEDKPSIGRERIRLLEAVGRRGSISAAAREIGLSYKAAWDALDAMANLFGHRLVQTRAGGAGGGRTELTREGLSIIRAYHRLEAELSRTLHSLEPGLAEAGLSPTQLMTGLMLQTSARNALRGEISAISSDGTSALVTLNIGAPAPLYAVVTADSVNRLGLVPGRSAIALVKAPFVIIAPGTAAPALSAHNCLPGTISRVHASEVVTEVIVDIGGEKTIVATVSSLGAERLHLEAGMPVHAVFDAAHVVLALD